MTNEVVQSGNFTPEQVDLIKKTICPGATNDELKIFLHVANKVQLDPFLRQIYSIERRSQKNGQWVTTRQIMISIDGQRLVAERSGKYAGQLGPFFCGNDGIWLDVWTEKQPPYASKVGVLRSDFKEPLWAIAIFSSYAQYTKDGKLNNFWGKFAELMISKVAEALALRKAFPQYLAGLYTQEEMDQAEEVEHTIKTNHVQVKDIKFDAPKTAPESAPKPIEAQDPAPKTYPLYGFGQFKGKSIDQVSIKDTKSYMEFLKSKDFKFNDPRNKDFFSYVAKYIGDNSFLLVEAAPVIFCWNCSESYASSLNECPNCDMNESDRPSGPEITTDEIPF